ncbi:unnamed protein product, partial [Staurois parvus]
IRKPRPSQCPSRGWRVSDRPSDEVQSPTSSETGGGLHPPEPFTPRERAPGPLSSTYHWPWSSTPRRRSFSVPVAWQVMKMERHDHPGLRSRVPHQLHPPLA